MSDQTKPLKLELTGNNGTWHDSHYMPDALVEDVIAGYRDHLQYRRKDKNYDLYDSKHPGKALEHDKTLAESGIKDGALLVFVDRESTEKIKIGDKELGT